MAKILIYGNPNSPLVRQRGLIGQNAGHEIIWFSHHQADLEDVTAFSMPSIARKNLLARAILEPFFLLHVLIKQQPDLVHVHFASKGLAAVPLLRFHPLIVSTMGSDIYPDQSYRGIFAPFIKLLLNHADCITSKSDFMDSALDNIGDFRTKLRRITWGIDLSRFHPNRAVESLRNKMHIKENAFVFFDPRSARPLYNKHIILEAFSKFVDQVDTAVLLISEMGAKKTYLQQIKDQAHQLDIMDNIRFLGSIPYQSMPDYYNLANVTISVPSSDGFPQTIYEAFACGSFLIVGDLPQYKGVIRNQENAKTVHLGNVDDLVRAMVWTYENHSLRDQAIKHNHEYVCGNADSVKQANLVNHIYNQLLDGSFS